MWSAGRTNMSASLSLKLIKRQAIATEGAVFFPSCSKIKFSLGNMERLIMTKKLNNFINGEWVEPQTDQYTPVINPATQEVLAECPDSNREDVNLAVEAAMEAYLDWRQTPVLSRVRYLMTFKNVLEDNFDDIAELV